ncbi:helix-turn-helix transcriptional regulator [Streptomyces sp. ISL-94]|uniref:helix-turn-helix domain-containing protein n=1 Tax=Streptomyces sp. ISL-94 TaxID=2819190 RepID=UPI001BE72096|nr:helix-turn-helix transcriptional regulator [Streptomyces sp. ISL-94]MBT2478518.1 helix-turn-helix transcriptional regulator [Streptomyces sp. ISL-94]
MHSDPQNLSDLAADQIRKHRTRLGLNREQLAEECARVGAPELTYAAITNIETGRRDKDGKRRREITIDELLTFAYALGVPPLLLMLPLGDMDATPSPARWGGLHPYYAWRWITGEEPPAFLHTDGRIYVDSEKIGGAEGHSRIGVWREVAAPTEVYRELQTAQALLKKASGHHHFTQARHGDDAEQTLTARRAYLDCLQELAKALNSMMQYGLRVPSYSAKWVNDMREFEMLDHPEAVEIFEPKENTD